MSQTQTDSTIKEHVIKNREKIQNVNVLVSHYLLFRLLGKDVSIQSAHSAQQRGLSRGLKHIRI